MRQTMGLQQFEQRLEQLVEGVFARAFRGGLQPVELGRRLTREMDLERAVGVRGPIAPNEFQVTLSERDTERFQPFAENLCRELEEAAREHAREEGYHLMGAVSVELLTDASLSPGVFRMVATIAAHGVTSALVLPDGSRVPVGDEPVVLGRQEGCTVVLSDPNVSRRHAEITRNGVEHELKDLKSTNGTRVNGEPVTSRVLVDGDEISLGTTLVRYETV